MTPMPNVLVIGGTDAAGAAGLAADLRTFAAFDVFGSPVVTAVTAQRGDGTGDVFVLPPALVSRQLHAAFTRVDVDAVKIGLLGDGDVAREIAAVLAERPRLPVVLDPVVRASSGMALTAPGTTDAILGALFPRATLVTPNANEAGILLGSEPPRSIDDLQRASRALVSLGAQWVLVKGGHVDLGDSCVDVLSNGRAVFELCVDRRPGTRRGTGCTLASAIAALLAHGWTVPQACAEAQRYVADTIDQSHDEASARIGGALAHRPWRRAVEVA
jgi:hydroxymethylpyrimidine/phosphomethylpyrimidine kinase